MANIIIPTPLRKFTDKQATLEVNGATIGSAIEDLATQFPALKPHLIDGNGKLRSFVRIYVGDEDIKALQGADTPIEANSEISIIPAIAGGICHFPTGFDDLKRENEEEDEDLEEVEGEKKEVGGQEEEEAAEIVNA